MTDGTGSGFESSTREPERRALFDLRRQNSTLLKRLSDLEGIVNQPDDDPIPPGTIIEGLWSTAPDGYLLLNGNVIAGGATLYPDLAAAVPSIVSQGNIVLPDARNRVTMMRTGGSIGAVGGANIDIITREMTTVIDAANLPEHRHGITHGHGNNISVSSSGAHTHTAATGNDTHAHNFATIDSSGSGVNVGSGSWGGSTATTTQDTHNHSVTVNSTNSAHSHTMTGGVDDFGGLSAPGKDLFNDPLEITPAWIQVNKAIKT